MAIVHNYMVFAGCTSIAPLAGAGVRNAGNSSAAPGAESEAWPAVPGPFCFWVRSAAAGIRIPASQGRCKNGMQNRYKINGMAEIAQKSQNVACARRGER